MKLHEEGNLPKYTFSDEIDGTKTDIVCATFSDRDFIMVTQYRKVGSLVSVTVEKSAAKPLAEPTYTTKVLMGKDEDMTHVFSRAIAETVSKCRASGSGNEAVNPSSDFKPLLCSLALKNPTPATLSKVMNIVSSCTLWT